MIKFLVMDVDGTLTDGKIYMGSGGELLKAFDIKDGYAIKNILPRNNIRPIIITARNSLFLSNRCEELGIKDVFQGQKNKLRCLESFLKAYSNLHEKVSLADVAYIGDDIPDLECMVPIATAGGFVGCPRNAADEVKSVSGYITQRTGGEGAVREFVDYIIKSNNSVSQSAVLTPQQCVDAIDFLSQLDFDKLSLGRHEVNESFYFNVDEYETSLDMNKPYESHQRFIDIQMIIKGEEVMQVIDTSHLIQIEPYNEASDCTFYQAFNSSGGIVFRPRSVIVLYPNDAHRSISYNSQVCRVKKIVGKLRIR